MGEDTFDNISLLLGLRWSEYQAKVLPIYHSVRISVLIGGSALQMAQRMFQKRDDQKWDELTVGMPRWSPRRATREEESWVAMERDLQNRQITIA